jgi:hypothetical protein
MARSGFGQGRATTLMMIIPLNVLFMGREVDLLQHREWIAAPRGDYRRTVRKYDSATERYKWKWISRAGRI